jgi:hypothetical protein
MKHTQFSGEQFASAQSESEQTGCLKQQSNELEKNHKKVRIIAFDTQLGRRRDTANGIQQGTIELAHAHGRTTNKLGEKGSMRRVLFGSFSLATVAKHLRSRNLQSQYEHRNIHPAPRLPACPWTRPLRILTSFDRAMTASWF